MRWIGEKLLASCLPLVCGVFLAGAAHALSFDAKSDARGWNARSHQVTLSASSSIRNGLDPIFTRLNEKFSDWRAGSDLGIGSKFAALQTRGFRGDDDDSDRGHRGGRSGGDDDSDRGHHGGWSGGDDDSDHGGWSGGDDDSDHGGWSGGDDDSDHGGWSGGDDDSDHGYHEHEPCPPVVPEPGTFALFGCGLMGLGLAGRRSPR